MWRNPQETADLVTFTEEILYGKLHFLFSVSLYSGSDLDDQIDRLVDTPPSHITNAKGGRINKEGEDSDDDDLIKDIENDFNSVE